MNPNDQNADRFLTLIRESRRGKFKVYIGMSAGVGKSYRMLQEAHALLGGGINVKIGFIETHNRAETVALVAGLPIIPRRKLFYKGRELEEMDVQAVINTHPELVIVDELAHTNIPGSKNEKRWQDVLDILDAGIQCNQCGQYSAHRKPVRRSSERNGDRRDGACAGPDFADGRRSGKHRPHGR